MSTQELNAVLQGVVDRSTAQKDARFFKMRGELHNMGYSIVATEWLNNVFDETAAANLKRIAREKAE